MKVTSQNNGSIWQGFACKIQQTIQEQVRKTIISKEAQDVLLGILLGNDDEIEEELKENFKNSSLSHILAVSGMHVAYIVGFVDYFLSKLKIGKQKMKVITIFFLVFFISLTNNTPSVRRACIMCILGMIAILIKRKSDVINNMAISLLAILLQNPFSLLDTGIILSYIATLGIILLTQNVISKDETTDWRRKIWQKIKSIMIVSISAQIAILPASMCLFQTISVTFIFSNLLVSFIIGLILVLGFLIAIPFQIPIISNIIASSEQLLLSILIKISQLFTQIPLSHILVYPPYKIAIALYYSLLLFYIYQKKLQR